MRSFFFFILALLTFSTSALAGISAPNSSLIPSADNTKVLVMVSPFPADDNTPQATLPDGRIINIHSTFPKSGVYDAGTLIPIWQVDWFALKADLLWSDDLRFVAQVNRRAFPTNWAFAFYDSGKITRTYDCPTLLPHMNNKLCLPFSTWDWHIRWYENYQLTPDHQSILFSTAHRTSYLAGHEIDLGRQEFYTFNLATGTITSQHTTGAWRIWVYLATALIVVSLSIYLAIKAASFAIRQLRNKFRNPAKRPGFPVA